MTVLTEMSDGRSVSVAVLDRRGVPAVGVEALGHVVRVGERGEALDGHVVVVVEVDELAEFQVPGERRGLGGHALH
jgi:hypothetical protein